MKCRWIEAFHTVVRSCPMMTAARALRTSQPGIDCLIAELEDEAGAH
ncbi:LysR family transcriptional regulator [Paraburkholderia caballeronis]